MMDTYTQRQVEAGEGRYPEGAGTCILQRGSEDVFTTEQKRSGWTPNASAGWHVAGSCGSTGGI